MTRVAKILRRVLTLLTFMALGIVCAGLLVWAGAYLHREGFLSRWERLPGSVQVQEITEVTSQDLFVRAVDGKSYFWSLNCSKEAECGQWLQREQQPRVMPGQYEAQGPDCTQFYDDFLFFPELADDVVDCRAGSYSGPGSATVTYYALTRNGEIYIWSHAGSQITDVLLILLTVVLGSGVGVLAFVKKR
ncbi:MAG: hypothetical protein KF701_03130 [Anaerolineales bacterium]|nr:MAG: hypothetical protein KF701_03130 [Anaerolineales bacterium]